MFGDVCPHNQSIGDLTSSFCVSPIYLRNKFFSPQNLFIIRLLETSAGLGCNLLWEKPTKKTDKHLLELSRDQTNYFIIHLFYFPQSDDVFFLLSTYWIIYSDKRKHCISLNCLNWDFPWFNKQLAFSTNNSIFLWKNNPDYGF